MFKFDQQTDACFCFVFFFLGGIPFEIKRLHRDSGAKGLFNNQKALDLDDQKERISTVVDNPRTKSC